MFRFAVWRVIMLLVAASIVWALAGWLGRWPGLGGWVAFTAAGCLLGMYLLKTSPTGQLTWRNRFAGYFLQFGYAISGGRLGWIVITSWVVWVLTGVAVVMLMPRADEWVAPAQASGGPVSGWMRGLVFVCWGILATGLLYLLGLAIKNVAYMPRTLPLHAAIIGGLAAITGGSVLLWVNGYAGLALGVAAAPIVVVGGFFGLFMLVILVFGRNMRWN